MSTSEILTGARTMWELVDRRAEASPDHPMLIAADGETVTFGAFRDRAERVAAGLHGMGVTTGSVVSWQLPTRIDTVVLSIALSRLGAVQNPIIHLYREREVGFALRQTGASLFVIPGTWRDVDFGGHRRACARRRPHPPDDPHHRRPAFPKADPAVLPPPPPGTAPEDAPIRWIYYTSGSTADPKGVQHTDQTLIAGGWGLARALDMGPDDVGSIAFPFAHIAGPDYLVTMLSFGFPAVLRRGLLRPRRPARLPPPRRDHGRREHRVLRRLPRRAAQDARRPDPPDAAAHVGRRRGQAARGPLRGPRRDRRARRGARLRHDRGADDLQRLAARHRRAAGQHRRQAGRGGRRPHRHPRRPHRRTRRGGRGPGEGPDGLPRLHRPVARRGGLRRRRLLPHGRPGPAPCRRAPHAHRPPEGRHRPQGGEHQRQGDRGPPLHPPQGGRGGGHRAPRPRAGRARLRGRCSSPTTQTGSSSPRSSPSAGRPAS